jgi:hypothetical protein
MIPGDADESADARRVSVDGETRGSGPPVGASAARACATCSSMGSCPARMLFVYARVSVRLGISRRPARGSRAAGRPHAGAVPRAPQAWPPVSASTIRRVLKGPAHPARAETAHRHHLAAVPPRPSRDHARNRLLPRGLRRDPPALVLAVRRRDRLPVRPHPRGHRAPGRAMDHPADPQPPDGGHAPSCSGVADRDASGELDTRAPRWCPISCTEQAWGFHERPTSAQR